MRPRQRGAVLVGTSFGTLEFWVPTMRLREAGVTSLVRPLDDQGKVVAQIRQAGLVGIPAGIVDAAPPPGVRASGTTS